MIALGTSWKTVLRKAWSVRLSALAAVFLLLEIALPLWGTELSKPWFVGLALVAAIGSIWARVTVQAQMQEAIDGDKK